MAAMHQLSWWRMFAGFIAVFLIWAGVGVEQIAFGVVAGAVAATVWFRHRAGEVRKIRWGALARFVPYFGAVSFAGGLDVARRAVMPSMPLQPAFIDYRLRMSSGGTAAVFFGAAISLMPGTLCVQLEEGETVMVHLIDEGAEFDRELQRLERRVAAIFGESIDERNQAPSRERG